MANEINYQLSVTVRNSRYRDGYQSDPPVRMDQAIAGGGNPGTVTLIDVEAAIDFGNVIPGIVVIKNLDAENDALFRLGAGDYWRIPAGGESLISDLNGAVLNGKSSPAVGTGSVSVDCLIKGFAK